MQPPETGVAEVTPSARASSGVNLK
jgi:hypothetical protein